MLLNYSKIATKYIYKYNTYSKSENIIKVLYILSSHPKNSNYIQVNGID